MFLLAKMLLTLSQHQSSTDTRLYAFVMYFWSLKLTVLLQEELKEGGLCS